MKVKYSKDYLLITLIVLLLSCIGWLLYLMPSLGVFMVVLFIWADGGSHILKGRILQIYANLTQTKKYGKLPYMKEVYNESILESHYLKPSIWGMLFGVVEVVGEVGNPNLPNYTPPEPPPRKVSKLPTSIIDPPKPPEIRKLYS